MKNKLTKLSIWITLILVLCVGASSSVNAATLRLISLECVLTEDSEVDEIVLKVIDTDGSNTRYNRNMRSGDLWRLNRRLLFTNRLVVALIDVDGGPFDPNDRLGSFIVSNEPTNGVRSYTFNLDGANYRLRYRVDE